MRKPVVPARALLRVGAAATLASASGFVAVAAAQSAAATVSTDIVISEVYGGGGNAGSYFQNDFIERYNTSGDDVVILLRVSPRRR